MGHIESVRAALAPKVTAPVIAIPIEGHAPICIKAKLLKGALKGVTIDSVEVLENRWLKVTGHDRFVHTCSKFAPMERNSALKAIGEWSRKERAKRVKIINQGVLSASAQREMKLKAAEQAGVAELIQARKEEQEILAAAKAHINPVLRPMDAEGREGVIAKYLAFRAQRGTRKRGSVIRWRLAKLREQVKGMTKLQCEYEILPPTKWCHRNRKSLKRKVTVLRKQKDKLRYAAILYQIGQLEKQFTSLYPPVWYANEYIGDGGYWTENWTAKRPTEQAYYNTSDTYSRWADDDEESSQKRRIRQAAQLKEARANIRALTPPVDEELTQEQIAA